MNMETNNGSSPIKPEKSKCN